MRRKLILAIVLLLVSGLNGAVLADLEVGVKSGQYIEYSVNFTGTPAPGHDIAGAVMTIKQVSGANITVEISSYFANGTSEPSITSYLNLETGQLIDDYIIPANLKAGDTFFDQNLGNVTIAKAEQRIYAGATRMVLSATVGNNSYVWDQTTGVSVEGDSQTADYSIHTVAVSTNMWQRQQGLDVTVLIVIVVTVIAFVLVVIALTLGRRGKYA